MVHLSVNINKVATLRNARGGQRPHVVHVALDCEQFGADGITVHPRPDQRHIRRQDVLDLAPVLTTEFNIEGFPDEAFLDLVLKVKPAQVTLVPDPPGVLTSNAGWDTQTHLTFLTETVSRLHEAGIRVSIFLDPKPERVAAAKASGTDRIELYTENYAAHYFEDRVKAITPYKITAKEALDAGLGLNAGHDLDLDNLAYFCREIEGLQEVSIGHALICDALYFGLDNTIRMYKHRCHF